MSDTKICPKCGLPQQWEMWRHCACGYDFGPPARLARQSYLVEESAVATSEGHTTPADETKRRISFLGMYRRSPILATLAAIAYINWFIFAGISAHFGGEALGVLPSKDGFIVTSHGHKTPVTESVWLFCLIYPYCTLMLTPATFLLLGVRQKSLSSMAPAGRWLVVAFLCVWSIGWYSSISRSFIRSLQDYRDLKSPNQALQQTAPER